MSTKKEMESFASVEVSCPQCEKKAMIVQGAEKVPLFGQMVFQTISCTHCGFRWSDVMSVESGTPAGYEMRVSKEKDLSTKIVRNSSGTVEIPELGLKLEPGSFSEGFFTNMEGLLERFEGPLKMMLVSGTPEQKKKVKEIMKDLHACRESKKPFTVRVLDPMGGSSLIGEKVKRFELSEKEVSALKKGLAFV